MSASSVPTSSWTPPPPLTTYTPSAASTSSSSSGSSGGTTSGSLYLYTFLSTLVLLLGVSSAIVFRSLILRRRHQRMIEEAIQNGNWLSTTPTRRSGRQRKELGEKPKMHEVWLDYPLENNDLYAGETWDDFKPLAAFYANVPSTDAQATQQPEASDTLFRPRRGPLNAILPWRLANARPVSAAATHNPQSRGALPSATYDDSPANPDSTVPQPSSLRVSVLIAMPAPSTTDGHVRDDTDLPMVEFGVVALPIAASESEIDPAERA